MYDLAVYIGRFQPFHYGHAATIEQACSIAKKVLVLVGSPNSARNSRNPFSFEERYMMIREWAMTSKSDIVQSKKIELHELLDCTYDDNEWAAEVQAKVKWVCFDYNLNINNVVIIGHDKDETTYYLDYFPDFKLVDTGPWPDLSSKPVDATKIRELYFQDQQAFYKGVVPASTLKVLKDISSEIYEELVAEYKAVENYKKIWAGSPFPPVFVTTDAIVLQNSHILLIQRKESPGKGNWALPGGFLGINERVIDSCIRELVEETKIHVPEKVLRGSITHNQVFDHPRRSSRGRTITHAYLFELEKQKKLPRVYGSDDAVKARWFPLADLNTMGTQMFEDHWHMAHAMINRASK